MFFLYQTAVCRLLLESGKSRQNIACLSCWSACGSLGRHNLQLLLNVQFHHTNTRMILARWGLWCISHGLSVEAATCSEVIYLSELPWSSARSCHVAPIHFWLLNQCPGVELISKYMLPPHPMRAPSSRSNRQGKRTASRRTATRFRTFLLNGLPSTLAVYYSPDSSFLPCGCVGQRLQLWAMKRSVFLESWAGLSKLSFSSQIHTHIWIVMC